MMKLGSFGFYRSIDMIFIAILAFQALALALRKSYTSDILAFEFWRYGKDFCIRVRPNCFDLIGGHVY